MERTLHRDYYFSPEVFQREKERIFCPECFCAGREEELPEPGDGSRPEADSRLSPALTAFFHLRSAACIRGTARRT
jgi:hypothetical protein